MDTTAVWQLIEQALGERLWVWVLGGMSLFGLLLAVGFVSCILALVFAERREDSAHR